MAANTDKFRKVQRKFSTTLASTLAQSATSGTLSSGSGLPTDTAVTLSIDRVDANGVATPSSEEVITGTISGSTFQNLVRGKEGTTDQEHAAGAVVEMVWTETLWNDAVDGFLAEHDQDGTHTDVTADSLTINASGNIDVPDGAAIRDGNNNELVVFQETASAVNQVDVTNAATGNAPSIAATGDDTNINLELTPKGTGNVTIGGNPLEAGAPTSYTPTWTQSSSNPTLGNGTLSGYYTKVGKLVFFSIDLEIGSTTSLGSGSFQFALPSSVSTSFAVTGAQPVGWAQFKEQGVLNYQSWQAVVSTGDRDNVLINQAGSTNNTLTNTNPFTWASGDDLRIQGWYWEA